MVCDISLIMLIGLIALLGLLAGMFLHSAFFAPKINADGSIPKKGLSLLLHRLGLFIRGRWSWKITWDTDYGKS